MLEPAYRLNLLVAADRFQRIVHKPHSAVMALHQIPLAYEPLFAVRRAQAAVLEQPVFANHLRNRPNLG